MEIPPRIGIDVTVPLGDDPATAALQAESVGFDVVTVHGDVLNGERTPREAWTTLTWVAARTTTGRLAPNVLVLPNRHPAVLAKMAESLDRLSGGPLRLAIGAGAAMHAAACAAFGLTVRAPGAAVDALEEAIDVMRGLWTTESVTYHGRHYKVEAAELRPRPQRPIPIWLGAYGPR